MTTPRFTTPDAPPVLIFGGKGGVGKTTTASAAALALAHACPDDRVLLVSTDPAHSVSDALADADLPANLKVVEIDAGKEHQEFMAKHAETLHAIGARGTFLEDEEISRFLDLSLPGVDELMCFVRIAAWLEEDAADRIIIDTAPTGHALRLLTMPHLLEQWLEATDALMGKHRYMSEVFGGGNTTDPVELFIEEISEQFAQVAQVWSDAETTAFVPVFNAEPMSIAETARLLDDLKSLEISAAELVCNRVIPAGATGVLAEARRAQRAALEGLPLAFTGTTVHGIPVRSDEPRGSALESFFQLADSTEALLAGGEDTGAGAPLPGVEGSLSMPRTGGPSITLLSGKGGVGKTTVSSAIACATALATGKRTLIASTDPAGSLGDAFGVPVGSDPIEISTNLSAVQLDADAELDAFKDEYAEELENFLDSFSDGLDLAFDREALEHLMDLAPTGIDEVMALVRTTEIIEEGGYDALILDTAPTGHTLRLLELPDLIQQWLEAIFSVLLNYEDVFSLPKINQRLIRFSKGLKSLRAMLADPDITTIVGVSIPTELASAETSRLIQGCERLGLPVGGVVINQRTPQSDDELTRAVVAREEASIANIKRSAGVRSVAIIDRGRAPHGVQDLTILGAMLLGGRAKQKAA